MRVGPPRVIVERPIPRPGPRYVGYPATTAGGARYVWDDMSFRLGLAWFGSLLAGFNVAAPGYLSLDSGGRSVPFNAIDCRWKAELHLKTTAGQVLGCDRSTV